MGCCPCSRSRIFRRTAPKEISPDSQTSCSSGPRCVSDRVISQIRSGSPTPFLWVNPAIPHTARHHPCSPPCFPPAGCPPPIPQILVGIPAIWRTTPSEFKDTSVPRRFANNPNQPSKPLMDFALLALRFELLGKH